MAQKIWKKLFLLGILFMLVIGFSVPLFQLGGDEPPLQPPARICQSDADCYLTCDDKPLAALCSQNLCQQNSCQEGNKYVLLEQPSTFNLEIEVGGEDITLSEKFIQGNFLVRMNDESVAIYTQGLFLPQVLEKFNIGIDEQCLHIGRLPYCNNLEVLVNGKKDSFPTYYTPQEGDTVIIRAS